MLAIMNHTFQHNASATLEQTPAIDTTPMLTSSTLTAIILSLPVTYKRQAALKFGDKEFKG